jgi:heme exporter protein A
MKIIAKNLGKKFNARAVIQDVNLNIKSGTALSITGPNGSGKTTLIRLLCGLVRPTHGKIDYFTNQNSTIPGEKIYQYIGLVGPYLELYEDLTAAENIRFFAHMKKRMPDKRWINELFERFALHTYRNQVIKEYSSGMRQRLKYIFALLSQPDILYLDEPTSNLDGAGSEVVYSIMKEQKRDKMLIFATNVASEIQFGDEQIEFHL